MKRAVHIICRAAIVVVVTVCFLVGTLYGVLYQFKNGPSESAKNMFITTVLETGQMKFLARLVCTQDEIDEIVEANKMQELKGDVDTGMITIQTEPDTSDSEAESQPESENADAASDTDETAETVETTAAEEFDANGIRLEEISGRTFTAKMLIIKNPAQVQVASTYPWGEYGKELDIIVSEAGAVAGINGGIYESTGNSGGSPLGVVVQQGQITYNAPYNITGCYMIGFNTSNILIIKDLSGMSDADFTAYVAENNIRDAVAFQDEASDADNHFVPLIINGEARQLNGQGSGANPRTVIGQRADGAILMLVTDGRGSNGHLGATASDLISIMQEYGAVNAANLDGGSSSTMVYNGNWEMTSVTFYYQNSSWRLPSAFVVMPAG